MMLQLFDAGPRVLEQMTSSLCKLLDTYRSFLWMVSAHALYEKEWMRRTLSI